MRCTGRSFVFLSLAVILSLCALAPIALAQSAPAAQSLQPIAAHDAKPPLRTIESAYGKLPLSFEANQGQTDQQVKFISRGPGYALFLTPDEAVLSLRAVSKSNFLALLASDSAAAQVPAPKATTLRMKLLGANSDSTITGLDQLPGVSNYYIGNDPSKWRTNVPTYERVKYHEVYPGVDLIFYGNQRQLEYDFVVAPGANPKEISLEIDGSSALQLNEAGDVVANTNDGQVFLRKPVMYQLSAENFAASNSGDAARKYVNGRFILRGKNRVSFEPADYDSSRPLIIDPVFVFASYLGGSAVDTAIGIAIDSNGNAYVTGGTLSADFPKATNTYGGTGANCGGADGDLAFACGDAFLSKINPTGTTLISSTYFGGSDADIGISVTLDPSNNVYLVGSTRSANFPNFSGVPGTPAFQSQLNEGGITPCGTGAAPHPCDDGFIVKVSPAGTAIYSSFLGGSDADTIYNVAADSSGDAFVTGQTRSNNFGGESAINAFNTTTCGNHPCSDAFLTEINPTGTSLLFTFFLGGSGGEYGLGISLIQSGGAAVVAVSGSTTSTDFPGVISTSAQPIFGGGTTAPAECISFICGDGFVSTLTVLPGNNPPVVLNGSTYLGGSSDDAATSVIINPQTATIYVSGTTNSANFTTTSGADSGPAQPKFGGGSAANCQLLFFACGDAFAVELDPTLSFFDYSTFIGGSGDEGTFFTSALDSSGNFYIGGITNTPTAGPNKFPLVSPLQAAYGGNSANCSGELAPCGDGFITVVNLDGSAFLFSTYLGGSGDDIVTSLAIDPVNSIYVAGGTSSTAAAFPVSSLAFQKTLDGTTDAFVAKIAASASSAIALLPSTLGFPGQASNATSQTEILTFSNGSGSLLSIQSITASTSFAVLSGVAGGCQTGAMAVGATCTVNLEFTPDGATGQINGTVTVSFSLNGVVSSVTSQLSALSFSNGIDQIGPLAGLTFPDQVVNTGSPAVAVTITNGGTGPMELLSIGTDNTDYIITNNNCPVPPATLAAQSFCTVNISFFPTIQGSDPGNFITTDDTQTGGSSITLNGNGVVSNIAVNPATLSFTEPTLGTATMPQPVVLTNSGSNVTVSTITTVGNAAGDFSPSQNCVGNLNGDDTMCTIQVTFTPSAVGPRTADLAITTTGPSATYLVHMVGNSDIRSMQTNPGFYANTLPANDDGSTALFPLGFTVNFFGTSETGLFINNNGNVTFDAPLSAFTPFGLADTNSAIIAPFFADVDTTGSGSNVVTFGTDTVNGFPAFAANYVNVGYFSSHFDKLNSFQVVLIDRADTGAGNFDIEFNEDKIQWETGDASGGTDGLGGSSAVVGFSNGQTPPTFFQLAGSLVNGALLDNGPAATALIRNSLNSTMPGRYLFQVRNGAVQTADLSVTMAAAPNPVAPLAKETFTVTVANAGPSNATNVTLLDTMPTNGIPFSITASQGACNGVNGALVQVSCNLGTINSGANATITIIVTVAANATGTISNSATVTSDQPDPNPNNNSASASSTITTTPPPTLVSIAITPLSPVIGLTQTQQFAATGTFSDNSMQDLTASVMWAAPTVPTVAMISNASGSQGLASAVALGTTTITATMSGVTGTGILTVAPPIGFVLTGSLITKRSLPRATLLNDGTVLISGGAGATSFTTLASAEIYNPTSGTFAATGNMTTPRFEATATLLPNGMVLVAGGEGPSSNILNSAELFNPSTGTFTATGNMTMPRVAHAATLLPNGTVLIAGGVPSGKTPTTTAEIYNPATGTFTATGSMTFPFAGTATLLNNGKVLLVGINGGVAGANLYDPATGTFTATTGASNVPNGATATLLNSGMVLFTGGLAVGNATPSCELYDPAKDAFISTGSMVTGRFNHTATLLNNGMVLIAAGYVGNNVNILIAISSAELYDPASGTFTETGSMNVARDDPTATLLNNGKVLVAGGDNADQSNNVSTGDALASAELYTPSTMTPPGLTSIAVTPANPTIPVGTFQRFVATGTFSSGPAQTLASVTWTSSNTNVATITNDAGSKGFADDSPGTTTITATAGTVSGSTLLTVFGPVSHFLITAPASATTGTSFTFTVTAQDEGNNTVTNYAGKVNFSSSDPAANFPANGASLTQGVGTFSATLNTPPSQTITATDSVTASITGTSNAIAVTTPGAALAITKTAPATVPVNGTLTYTIVVTNNGPAAATGVTMTDPVPDNLPPTMVIASEVCTRIVNIDTGATTLSCAIGTLANGASTTIKFNVSPTAAGIISNTATVTGTNNTNTTTNSATANTNVGAAAPALTITKSHTGNFTVGQQGAQYTILISNGANAAPTAGTVTLTDAIPTGLALTNMAGTGWICTVATATCTTTNAINPGTMAPTITVTVNVTATTATQVTNSATVSGGGAPAPITAMDPTNITSAAVPLLSISKTHSGNFTQGQQGAIYTITVTNGANAAPTSGQVTVAELIPTGLSLASISGTGWNCVENDCTRSDSLKPGASYQPITVSVNVAANAPAQVTNMASVSGGGTTGIITASDLTNITPTGAPVLTISKMHSGSFTVGQQGATYTITVSNTAGAGPTTGGVSVTDFIPEGLALVNLAGMGWTCGNSVPANVCTRADVLAAGSSYPSITVTVNVTATTATQVTNSAMVSGGGTNQTATANDPTAIVAVPFTLVISNPPGGNPNSPTPVSQGGQVAIGLILTPINGFSGTVTFTCISSSPQFITCSPAPGSIKILPGGSQVAIVLNTFCAGSVPTIGPENGPQNQPMNGPGNAPLGGPAPGAARIFAALELLLAALALGSLTWSYRRRPRWALTFAVLMLVALGSAACNSLPKGPNGATPPGPYSVTIMATANGQTATVNVPILVVQ
ncbi:MAG: kelch repeat-containing protein [Candidatus Acidiferrales bacterium]